MASILVKNVSKYFGDVLALDNINFECAEGVILAVLGPPGAGKTTLLKVIAGLEAVNSGKIFFGSTDFTDIDPRVRNVSMAFESYALYPHLTVKENIVHPLRVRGGYNEDDIQRLLKQVTEMLRIEHLLDRKTNQLSGGQRQRVGLARALIRENPNILLLDEPIAHLDASLRHWLRGELKRFLKERGTTTIYATPDYLEAMAMGDRVIVLSKGKIIQVGSPDEILNSPSSTEVAGFIGDPPTNIISAAVIQEQDGMKIDIQGNKIKMPDSWLPIFEKNKYENIILGIKPSDLIINDKKTEDCFEATVYVSETLQRKNVVTLNVGEYLIKVNAPPDQRLDIGDNVWVKINFDKTLLFDPETKMAVQKEVM